MNGGMVAMKIPAIGINDDSSVNSEKNSIPLIYINYNVMIMIIMMLVMKGMMMIVMMEIMIMISSS